MRVYRQGLGDCILVRVKRSDHDDFKLMIDCGVVLGTPDAGKIMTRVMENLVSDTQEKVDVLAITHEHWDHLSGFTQASDSFGKLGVGGLRKPDRCSCVIARTSSFSWASLTRFSSPSYNLSRHLASQSTTPQSIISLRSSWSSHLNCD